MMRLTPVAFVRAPLDEEIYMRKLQSCRNDGRILKLNKALYKGSEKISPSLVESFHNDPVIIQLGFNHAPHELCCITF